MSYLLLLLLLAPAASADNRWKKGEFVDSENARWVVKDGKAKSPDRTAQKTDPDGTVWYKDKEGDLFYLDPELLVAIYKGNKGFYRKGHKETRVAFDYLCRERERNRFDGTPFFSEFQAATLKFPIRSYYEDVDRITGLFRQKNCPPLKDTKKFARFLEDLNAACGTACAEMASGHQRGGDFELDSYPKHREQEQVAECRMICSRTHTKERNALQVYEARDLVKFLEPVGAGKKGGFEIEEYKREN